MKEQEVSTSLSNLNLVEIENKPSQDCLSIDLNVVDIFEDSKLNDVISSPNESVIEKDNSIRSFNPFNQEHRSIGEARSDLLRIFEAGPPVEKSDMESRKEKELNHLWKSTMNQIEELCVHCPTTIEKSIDAWGYVHDLLTRIWNEKEIWYRACFWEEIFRQPEELEKMLFAICPGFLGTQAKNFDEFPVKRFRGIGKIHIDSIKRYLAVGNARPVSRERPPQAYWLILKREEPIPEEKSKRKMREERNSKRSRKSEFKPHRPLAKPSTSQPAMRTQQVQSGKENSTPTPPTPPTLPTPETRENPPAPDARTTLNIQRDIVAAKNEWSVKEETYEIELKRLHDRIKVVEERRQTEKWTYKEIIQKLEKELAEEEEAIRKRKMEEEKNAENNRRNETKEDLKSFILSKLGKHPLSSASEEDMKKKRMAEKHEKRRTRGGQRK